MKGNLQLIWGKAHLTLYIIVIYWQVHSSKSTFGAKPIKNLHFLGCKIGKFRLKTRENERNKDYLSFFWQKIIFRVTKIYKSKNLQMVTLTYVNWFTAINTLEANFQIRCHSKNTLLLVSSFCGVTQQDILSITIFGLSVLRWVSMELFLLVWKGEAKKFDLLVI